MSHCFHLAIPAGKLEQTVPFYTKVLGCVLGNKEEGRWQDVNFWGNELTLHESNGHCLERERHDVDMGKVCVPHFGIHLEEDIFQKVKQNIIDHNIPFLDDPYRRFVGTDREQETFFVEDPHGNVLEIKTMVDDDLVFSLES